jgi:hypothetical protein
MHNFLDLGLKEKGQEMNSIDAVVLASFFPGIQGNKDLKTILQPLMHVVCGRFIKSIWQDRGAFYNVKGVAVWRGKIFMTLGGSIISILPTEDEEAKKLNLSCVLRSRLNFSAPDRESVNQAAETFDMFLEQLASLSVPMEEASRLLMKNADLKRFPAHVANFYGL